MPVKAAMNDKPDHPETPTPAPPSLTLCPYCGTANEATDKCKYCGGLFEPLSMKATQIAMGPWFIRDKAQPFRPGCSFETLVKMIDKGQIKPNTVLRGPTTAQFWSVARNTPGVAHRLGFCHMCNAKVDPTAPACPSCNAPFETPPHRDTLGLRYPTATLAKAAEKRLESERAAAGVGANDAAQEAPSVEATPQSDAPEQAHAAEGLLEATLGQAPAFNLAPTPAELGTQPTAPTPSPNPTPAPVNPLIQPAAAPSPAVAPSPAADVAPPRQGLSYTVLTIIVANIVLVLVVALLLYLLATEQIQL